MVNGNLPLEVIGMILSRLDARDSIIASRTCKQWKKAWQIYLHALSFNSNAWPGYRDLIPSKLEFLITKTIFQTRGLQCLLISMDMVDAISESTVVSWIMYTKETLRHLHCNVWTDMNINVLKKCLQKLEVLSLARTSLNGVESSYLKFPCLKSLSLSYVKIFALNLSFLLTACPKLEVLALINPDIEMPDAQATLELCSPSLKDIYLEAIAMDRFILEADSLEKLKFKDCALQHFELIGKEGSLRVLKIDNVIGYINIGEHTENLEVVNVSCFTSLGPRFYQKISKSSKLRRLQLRDLTFNEEDVVIDFETISAYLPQLSYLTLSYGLGDGVVQYNMQGSSHLKNITVLELGWTAISDLFSDWVAGVVQRCPNLKKLVIYGDVSEAKTSEECQILANSTASIVYLKRKYSNVEILFEYE